MLTKAEQNALEYFRSGVRTWTMTVDEELYKQALRLEMKGLVRFEARFKRNKSPDGHDIVALQEG